MYSLALSLGHNSSAVLIQDGEILAGYEEERFSGAKSDSHFPIQSILELRSRYGLPKDTDVYAGHWFIDAQLPLSNKYWNAEVIKDLFPNGEVHSLSPDFTHHDSHLESAMVFAHPFTDAYTAVVADGFGSFGECISIYEVTGQKYKLLNRVFGFEKSMGMLYQYATAFMGMKMNNHEYKMLAYEVHASKVLIPTDLDHLKILAKRQATQYLKGMYNLTLTSAFDPVTKLDALPQIQAYINTMLMDVLVEMEMTDVEVFEKRVVISYFVQQVVELVMSSFVGMYSPQNLLVVGGLFYNVKLNHILANQIPGKFCVMPLSGDQGAAIGVYNAYQGDLIWPDHLTWGDRDLIFDQGDLPKGIVLVESEEQLVDVMDTEIDQIGFVNVVRGKLEFGPRALCNTSTVALPDPAIAKTINTMNDRTMEMPFAPVMTRGQAYDSFLECDKIHKSLEYMIVTRTYKPGMGQSMLGAAHYYPEESVYTGRPQITAEPVMAELLGIYGPLVNTSFNYHGVPIVRSEAQIIDTHNRERSLAPHGHKPTTVILRNQA